MPRALPTKSTSLRGWRVFTSSPSASPGKRWPPVPPPATSSLIARAPGVSSLRSDAALEKAARAAADGEQNPRSQAGGDETGHSIRKEGQRHSLGRQERQGHSGVDQRFHGDEQRQAQREPAAERIGRGMRGLDSTPDQDAEEEQDGGNSGEAKLFADDAQDEVGMRGRKEEELLVALAQADAERAAGAEAKERLDRLIAVDLRIFPRVQESQHPLQAITRMPDQEGDHRSSRADEREEVREPRARHEEQREGHAAEDDGGAEVGLPEQERAEEAEHHQVRQEADGEDADALLLLRQRPRKPQHQRDLRDFAGLENQWSELHPTPGAAGGVAETRRVQKGEERQRDDDQRNGENFEPAIAELHRDEERGEAGDGADGLPLEEPEAVAQARAGIDGRCAVDHDHAEGEQEQHGAEQHRVIAKHGLGGAATGYAGSGVGARGHESLRTNCLNCSPRASK